MKINMAAETKSSPECQSLIAGLAKEFCENHKIPFTAGIYSHLLGKGSDIFINWAKKKKIYIWL